MNAAVLFPAMLRFFRSNRWLLACVPAVAILAFGYAAVANLLQTRLEPPLGLIGVGFGLLAGLLTGLLARRMHPIVTWTHVLILWSLIACGQVGSSLQIYRLGVALHDAEYRHRMLAVPTLFSGTGGLPAESTRGDASSTMRPGQAELEAGLRRDAEVRHQLTRRFPYFLKNRVGNLGVSSVPLAACLWALEQILGATLGTWTATRLVRRSRMLA